MYYEKNRDLVSIILILSILCTNILSLIPNKKIVYASDKIEQTILLDDKVKITFQVNSQWESGFEGQFIIKNISKEAIENWKFQLLFKHEITNIWDGEIIKHEGDRYLIGYPKYNIKIPVGGKATIGFNAKKEGNINVPTNCELLIERSEAKSEDYTITYKTTSDWKDGFNGEISITNNTNELLEGWQLEFDFNSEIKNFWTVKLIKKENDHYIIKGDEWNSSIKPKETLKIGFEGKAAGDIEEPKNYKLSKAVNEGTISKQDKRYQDSDGDLLTDYDEELYGTDPNNYDTDGDGIKDGYEVYVLKTDPLKKDTDGNGINDGDEDFDQDGVSNLIELEEDSDPFNDDSDFDGLKDGDEYYKYHTSMIYYDTDEDGLSDYDEIELGFDPNDPDTNKNGILDGDEKISQTLKIDLEKDAPINKVKLDMKSAGNIKSTTKIDAVGYFDRLFGDLKGLVGEPVDINTESKFDNAVISFFYNKNKLNGVKEEDLGIIWYNTKDNKFELMENAVLDKKSKKISLKTTHFSEYAVVSKSKWNSIWDKEQNYRDSKLYSKNSNICIVIDNSSSMKVEQLDNIKKSIHAMIKELHEKDKVCIISYTTKAVLEQTFTVNKTKLKKAIKNISVNKKSKGIIEKESGIRLALQQLDNVKTKSKAIIVISDDNIGYQEKTLEKAKEKNVRIFPISVDKSMNAESKKLAEKTIGEYYNGVSLNKLKYSVKDALYLIQDGINTKDEDNDGLYDVFETKGMRIINGKLLYSNPNEKDSDKDGLSDFNEMTSSKTKDNKSGVKYIKNNKGKRIRIFYCSSYPKKKDSDGDGIRDDKDESRLYHTCTEYEKNRMENPYIEKEHKWSPTGTGYYKCKTCKKKINTPEREDKKVLSKLNLMKMRTLQECYLICLAERKAGNKKYYQNEIDKLLLSMESIRRLPWYKGKYSYSDKEGNYIIDKKLENIKKPKKRNQNTKIITRSEQITKKNIRHYDGTDLAVLSFILGFCGFGPEFQFLMTFVNMGVNENIGVTDTLDLIILTIKKKHKQLSVDLLKLNRIIALY